MDHLSAAGSSATRNLTTTEPSESLNRRKTVDFRFQRPHATSGSFFFNKPMRAMDSRRDFTSKKVFSGYFSELGEKANSALTKSWGAEHHRAKRKLAASREIQVLRIRVQKGIGDSGEPGLPLWLQIWLPSWLHNSQPARGTWGPRSFAPLC